MPSLLCCFPPLRPGGMDKTKKEKKRMKLLFVIDHLKCNNKKKPFQSGPNLFSQDGKQSICS